MDGIRMFIRKCNVTYRSNRAFFSRFERRLNILSLPIRTKKLEHRRLLGNSIGLVL